MSYRILSLDGGGVRGVLTAVLLDRLVKKFPDLLDKVDLFAGTSTGAILALGLAYGLKPGDLIDFYQKRAQSIFADEWFDMGGITRAKYDNQKLRAVFEKIFGEATLGDLKKRVLVPTFDLDNKGEKKQPRMWKPKFFHNFPGTDSDRKERVTDVLMRTTAAPTYFPSFHGYIDGGMVANNPSMAALAQALDSSTGKQVLRNIRLLSLGTGFNPTYLQGDRLDWGLEQWAPKMVSLMMDGMMSVADFQCERMLGARYQRVSLVFAQVVRLDDAKKIRFMVDLAQKFDLAETIEWMDKTW